MKRCPVCKRTYTDLSLNFCLEDGTPLVPDAAPPFDPNVTVRYSPVRDTEEPPPTEIYRQPSPVVNQVPGMVQQPWPVRPPVPPQKKSNALWWVLGGFAVIAIIGIGMVVMIIAVASISNDNSANRNINSNGRAENRNSNSANTNYSNSNSNTTNLPASLTDDFDEHKWTAANSTFGEIWYADDEYHMRSKDKTFLVMYAPSNDYNTENATVRVTTRSVDGRATSSGYGLIIHGEKAKNNNLEDYALLIDSGDEPQYQIVMHKNGNQSALVPWTKSTVIRTGTNPNQLEARVKGTEISFYINGQYVNRITDSENFRRGLAGFYTSDTVEVAFDDLEITR